MARILIIEDNQDNLALMTYLLKAFGHDTRSARDGMTGLALARSGDVDLIVCDIHLPKIDGYEIARRLKLESGFRPPLIAVTALAMVGDRDKVLAAGFDGYISKPIEPTTFVSQIEARLAHVAAETPRKAPFEESPLLTGQTYSSHEARILVVDDSPVNHQLTRALLGPLGYRLSFATDTPSALEQIAHSEFELVLSDLHMPGEDGLVLLARIRSEARWHQLPVMLISSSAIGDTGARVAADLGVDRFLRRPLEPEEILRAIEQSLQKGRVAMLVNSGAS